MSTNATSLKLPARLKARIERLARKGDESPHALMIRAIQSQVDAMELHENFVEDAVRADKVMEASGLGYEAEAVHDYLRARLAGRKAKRPKPVAWRG